MAASIEPELLTRGYGLIEGPVWDPARGLLFSDVLGGGVFCLDACGSVSVISSPQIHSLLDEICDVKGFTLGEVHLEVFGHCGRCDGSSDRTD